MSKCFCCGKSGHLFSIPMGVAGTERDANDNPKRYGEFIPVCPLCCHFMLPYVEAGYMKYLGTNGAESTTPASTNRARKSR